MRGKLYATTPAVTGQLSSDQIKKCWLAPWAAKGFLTCRAHPDSFARTSDDIFNFLAVRGLTRDGGMQGIEPGSPYPQSSPLPLHHLRGHQSVFNVAHDVFNPFALRIC